jgi:hypothetical protein
MSQPKYTYQFKTKRFEIVIWETTYFQIAEVWNLPRKSWPISVAADVRKTKPRNTLLREAISRASEKIIFQNLRSKLCLHTKSSAPISVHQHAASLKE